MVIRSIFSIRLVLLVIFTVVAVFVLVGSISAASRTQTVFASSGQGVGVIPYVRVDSKAMFVDFEHKDFNNIEYVYYKLDYGTIDPEIKRAVEGSFIPDASMYDGEFDGKPYIRHELLFASCSNKVCTYERGVNKVKLTVNTKFLTGAVDQYTQVLTFPDDQF